MVAVRAQVTTTETDSAAKVEKVHKKNVEGLTVNKFKPKNPYIGRCLLNTKITGDDAPGETWHMVFSTESTYINESSLTVDFLGSLFTYFLYISWPCLRGGSIQRGPVHRNHRRRYRQEGKATQASTLLHRQQRYWRFWRFKIRMFPFFSHI